VVENLDGGGRALFTAISSAVEASYSLVVLSFSACLLTTLEFDMPNIQIENSTP